MVCHSEEFVLSVLQDKSYFNRLSDHLIEQILGLECDDFSRLRRAIDAVEAGSPTTRFPGDFRPSGLLAGYGHFHYRKGDWAATNLAAEFRKPITQSLDITVDALADKVVAKGGDPDAELEKLINKFSRRIGQASGDWVLYCDGLSGREYLAINQHTDPNSDEERELRRLLDRIVAGNAQH
ncbi:hypothetical protein HUS84_12275 [Pseudomonas chlororaphis]|uniref:hypothetical protein n=1 Tax=Pseudomonas chlororaphis TaxID=587753 RepID=UPI001B341CBD|nr:hypothetical protein [Pseudomonas chlororaphis]MBP5074762.1 hypothetical protein [Pseudomonas chlororaphis]